MSLNWDVSKCEKSDELINEESWGVTNGIIWMMLMIDMGNITKENIDEVNNRAQIYQRLKGGMLSKVTTKEDGSRTSEEVFITREDIERRIGLTTNVSNDKPRWNRKVKIWLSEVK